MAIKNQDGTPYKLSGSLQQFDPENIEHDLFNVWDQEAIEIGGTPLFYYEAFIDMNSIDPHYVEARGKIISNCPICIYGYYDPISSQNLMGPFGADSPDEIMFEFNLQDVKKRIGHVPVIGSRLFSPHKSQDWEIVQLGSEVFKLWGEIRLQVMCIKWQESLTTGEGKVTQKKPNFKMNEIKNLGNS